MTTYYMKFINSTKDWWHFGVYQTFTDSLGLDSVIWRDEGLPNDAHVVIQWEMNYGVALTEFGGNRYSTIQVVDASLGDTYQVISRDDITGISSDPLHTGGSHDIIGLKNNTYPAESVDIGFALSGAVIGAQRNVGGQQQIYYQVNPKYHVALFHDSHVGDLVYPGITTAPIEVEYKNGYTFATVTAYNDAGNTCTTVDYGNPPLAATMQ